jgi:hypothetical protein
MNASDFFVIYDDVQFTKKGWINRNRVYSASQTLNFNIPCKSSPEETLIRDKMIAGEFQRKRVMKTILNGLGKSPNSNEEKRDLISRILLYEQQNLFKYIHNSLLEICQYLRIDTGKMIVSSSLGDYTNLRSQEKVIAICKSMQADTYINPISGIGLYESKTFRENGIKLESFTAKINCKDGVTENTPPSVIQTIWELSKSELNHGIQDGVIQIVE